MLTVTHVRATPIKDSVAASELGLKQEWERGGMFMCLHGKQVSRASLQSLIDDGAQQIKLYTRSAMGLVTVQVYPEVST